MDINVFYGILIPFLGTSAGAACVFFMKKNLNEQIQRALTGFAAGMMNHFLHLLKFQNSGHMRNFHLLNRLPTHQMPHPEIPV